MNLFVPPKRDPVFSAGVIVSWLLIIMKLSHLQKFILVRSLLQGGKIERNLFRQFYGNQAKPSSFTQCKPAKEKYQESIITKSLEHLIDRELLIGYGRRTPHKWFVTHVKLTQKGAKISQILLEEKQIKLPLK